MGVRTSQWTVSRDWGRERFSELGMGAATKEWNSRASSAGSGLRCRNRRRGWGLRPRQADPRPHGGTHSSDPGEVPGVDRAGLGRWAEPAARAEGVRGARGPGGPASRPSSSRPRTSVSARRRAGHAHRSCRRLRPCRKPPPLVASGPVSSAAPSSSSSGPVPPLPALPSRSEPPPPPQSGPSPHPSPA